MGVKVPKQTMWPRDYPDAGSLLTQTKSLLRRFGLQARKGLGQHFLIDKAVLGVIISAAELTSADVVIEIGPGLGVLTRELTQKVGRVVTVELDNKLAAILKQTLSPFNNVVIVNEDILKIDPAVLLQQVEFSQAISSPFHYKVLANLPYYITSPVLRHFLEASAKPEIMVLMIQKEVAESIVAGPGRMSLLSVSVQFYGKPAIVSIVPAGCFYPAPGVDSAILKIGLYSQPAVEVTNKDSFFKLVRAGFSASRKQIGNSLAQGLGLGKAEVLPLLEKANIAPRRRAETLTLDEWANLCRVHNHREEK